MGASREPLNADRRRNEDGLPTQTVSPPHDNQPFPRTRLVVVPKLTSGGLFMNGRAWLFSAASATDVLAAGAAGEKATADPARRDREASFIMVGCEC